MIMAMLHSDPRLLIQIQRGDGIEFLPELAPENKWVLTVINAAWSSGDPWEKLTYLIQKQ